MEDNKKVYQGIVIWFNKLGIGFIDWSKDDIKQVDLFCHYSDLSMEGFKMLHKGQVVSFEIGTNHKGQPKATNVKVLEQQK
jgi:CspA family cold shock protein